MEKIIDADHALEFLCSTYPALYECNCLALRRSSGSYRSIALEKVLGDLESFYRCYRRRGKVKEQPFVILFSAVGGCLWEALLLVLLANRIAVPVEILILEPEYNLNISIQRAVESFGLLVNSLYGSTIRRYNSLDEYIVSVQERGASAAHAYIAVDSDRAEDAIFLLDRVDARQKINQRVPFHNQPALWYLASLASHEETSGTIRHLYRSLVLFRNGFAAGFQLVQSGQYEWPEAVANCWLGDQAFFPPFCSWVEQQVLGGMELPGELFQRFLKEQDFEFLYSYLASSL